MGCVGCSTVSSTGNSLPGGCNNNGSCGVGGGCNKLNVFDWLANMELPGGQPVFDIVEVRFKNSRKDFFRNVNNLQLHVGDVIAVEASPGHDMGVVSIAGELVRLQMKKRGVSPSSEEIKKVYRKAKPNDIDKWQEAQTLEKATMYRARTIAINLNLQMKISDVEYQGDKTKAMFYYTADERVDFRELIKVLADEFKVRIEMRQIGARQEAGRLGGIGSCGRELCCATWLTDFISVTTTHAKYQELSLNPQKLAGQCSKLKCCLNFELDCYVDAQRSFPPRDVPLEALDCTGYFQKLEIHKGLYWYSTDPHSNANLIALPVHRVKEIQAINRKGKKVDKLKLVDESWEVTPVSQDLLKNNSLTRFDPPENKNQQSKNPHKRKNKRFNDKRNK